MSICVLIYHLGLIVSQDFIRGTSHPYTHTRLNHPHRVSSYPVTNLLTVLNALMGGIQVENNMLMNQSYVIYNCVFVQLLSHTSECDA